MRKHRKKPDVHLWRMELKLSLINEISKGRLNLFNSGATQLEIAEYDRAQFIRRSEIERNIDRAFPL
jgi:hypothetical protein